MSVLRTDEDNQTFEIKHEEYIENSAKTPGHFRELIKANKISTESRNDEIEITLKNCLKTNIDWNSMSDYLSNHYDQLRELKLRVIDQDDHISDLLESGFDKLINAIKDHPTLENMFISFESGNTNNFRVLFKGLKDNWPINHLTINSTEFDWRTERACTQILANNQSLLSLTMEVYNGTGFDSYSGPFRYPISSECLVELSRSLQKTVLERLRIQKITDKGFEVLASYLPTTLIHLDLDNNDMGRDIIPILDSYLKSNGRTLKELVLDDSFPIENLQEVLSSATVQIAHGSSVERQIFGKDPCPNVVMSRTNERGWSFLMKELTKDDTYIRKLRLLGPGQMDEKNRSNYSRVIAGKQSPLTSLAVENVEDEIMQIELFRIMKENKSITELTVYLDMGPNVFHQLTDLLKIKNNFTSLILAKHLGINDEDIIALANNLTFNTVLQHFEIVDWSDISDTGFQVLLSSLPQSIHRLILSRCLVTEKSLPFLFDFIMTHPNLQEVRIRENQISNISRDFNVPELLEKIFQIAKTNGCICELNINNKVKEALAESTNGYINLSSANLRDQHIFELSDAIQKKANQDWFLNLEYNREITHVGYSYLADLLSSPVPVRELSVQSNCMNEEEIAALFHALSDNKTLRKLILNRNKLIARDMEHIGHFIQNNPELKEIQLYSCSIDSDDAVHLAKFLPESDLQKLDFSENSLGDLACAAILSSIPSTLTDLSLRRNEITESSFQTIVHFLTKNQALKRLDLNYNPIFSRYLLEEKAEMYKEQLNEVAKQNGICELISSDH